MIADELHELLAVHALDALEPHEAAELERFIQDDEKAQAELAEFRRAGAWLASPGCPAPDGVWDRIVGDLFVSERDDRQRDDVVLLDERRARTPRADVRRAPRHIRWLAAAAVVVGVAVAAGTLLRGSSSPQGSQLAQMARTAQTAPGARPSSLLDGSGHELAHAVILPDSSGYLTADLPRLPVGRTYQLWALVDTGRISLGVLGRDPDVAAFTAAARPWGLAVTAEARGGVPTTHAEPVALGKVETP